MRVLIIGGTGHISTTITRLLTEQQHEVVLYNRGQTQIPLPTGVSTIVGDRQDFHRFEQQIAEAEGFDVVIDMVCYRPEEAESAVRALRGRTEQFVFCSTVDVYQKPAPCYPIQEDTPRIGSNAYGQDKILCEDIFLNADRDGIFRTNIIRPAMTYGEGRGILDWATWSPRYLDRIRKGKPLIVHGDGSSLWSVCHVEDVARTFVHALKNSATYGKAYHVTGEEWLTWNAYFQQAAEAMGAPEPHLIHIPTDLLAKVAPERAQTLVTNLQGNNIFDNAAARRDLQFRYTISWQEGVRRVVAWLDARGLIDGSDRDPLDDQIINAWAESENLLIHKLKG